MDNRTVLLNIARTGFNNRKFNLIIEKSDLEKNIELEKVSLGKKVT